MPADEDQATTGSGRRTGTSEARSAELAEVAAIMALDPAGEDNGIGYIARAFVACGLPHREPGGNLYVRHNGPHTLTLTSSRGIPYGKIPRLFLMWLQTEVVRRRISEVCLGNTLSEATRRIGLADAGTTLAAVSKQVRRATATTYEATYHGGGIHRDLWFRLATKVEYRYDPQRPAQAELWEPTITISADLFHELVADGGGVPFDWRMVRALRSPLAIDLYVFATHTTHRIRSRKEPLRIGLHELQQAFGGGYPNTPQGRKDFQKALKQSATQVAALWPGLPLTFERGAVLFSPGRPHINPTRRNLPPAAET